MSTAKSRFLGQGAKDSQDQLFSSADDWRFNACVDFLFDDWDLYAQGYRKAGGILATRLAETGGEEVDFLVYPLVFLFRHALELQLKSVIRWGRRALQKPSSEYPSGHKLFDFWGECRVLAEEFWPSGPSTQLDEIEQTLKEFQKHDPIGQAFRYSTEVSGAQTKPGLTHINIRAFCERAIAAFDLLDGMSTAYECAWQEWSEHQP